MPPIFLCFYCVFFISLKPCRKPLMSVLSVRFASHSSAGVKQKNDDALAVKVAHGGELVHKGITAVIADGASCCSSAEIASRTAVTDFINNYYSTPDSWTVEKSATRVLSALNNWLFAQGHRALNTEDSLVTTLSAAIIKGQTAYLFHVGDSRIYLYRDNELALLTQDHCHYQRANKLYLTRALGIDNKLQIDFKSVPLQVGDQLLFTTDGIHDAISPQQLTELMASQQELQDKSDAIAAFAADSHSDDNLTCLLVEVESLPLQTMTEAQSILTSKVIPPVMAVGNEIDGYKIVKVLHSNTRSHVYLVESSDETQWVLKAPSENFSDDPQYLEGFVREAWVGEQIDHDNVMRCQPADSESPFRYHLCEYIDGITLRQWMYDHPTPDMALIRPILKQVISGIRALQRHQMVHRDLKPENIMIRNDGTVKLVDFGTVQVAGLDEIERFNLETCPVGSVDYIAPEYLMGHKGTFQSDLFSLGVIVYEMLCGERPFSLKDPKLNPPTSLNVWQYTPLAHRKTKRPLWIDLAIKKACSPNPKNRQHALSEFLHDISQPNDELIEKFERAPLIERSPLTFWQVVAGLLLLANLVQLYWFNR
ncbi:bifunctional protein-serine/threonine kinase/phosphatase [Corallincola holothuriorum]|uniref:Bifunctional protein-serine/threonine kinase/phosphatase n=2 Tax=Corallincola holothuriorum TaxID=2282215 RepID=A0A368NRH6_9GAMM|nr:bifunctional protein-serine/threonine kinase/phosphatase [Corallincola holothuriorum]